MIVLYYLRKLWLHNLGVCNMSTQKTTCFLCAEQFAGKGPNEVLSSLSWYIDHNIPAEIETLHVFMDNLCAQGNNRYVFAFWDNYAQTRFKSIHLHYPVPGHSYMPIARVFV